MGQLPCYSGVLRPSTVVEFTAHALFAAPDIAASRRPPGRKIFRLQIVLCVALHLLGDAAEASLRAAFCLAANHFCTCASSAGGNSLRACSMNRFWADCTVRLYS